MKQTPGGSLRKVILASSAGTMIEWYDFYIFGSLASILSTRFFPKDDPAAAFLATLAAFGVGFVIRPFGAIVFGRLGDLMGRKYTFMLTLLIMGGSTFAIGLIPGYETIGMAAPVLVFILRGLQGLALGGEYGGATIYVAEHAPEGKKGFFTSFIQTTATLGLFISIGVILACKAIIGESEFEEWGWRIPFLLSSVLVILSWFIRKRMDESPEFAAMKKDGRLSRNPLKESFGSWANLKWVLLALFGATAGQGVVWYTGQFYAMNFCTHTLNVDASQIQQMLLLVLVLGTPLFVFFGRLSDRVGRKWVMLPGMLLAALSYLPLYRGMAVQADVNSWREQNMVVAAENDGNRVKTVFSNGAVLTEETKDEKVKTVLRLPAENLLALGMLIFVQLVFVTMAYGPIAAFLVEMFPARIRYTSLSFPYHIGNGVFGGLTPLIAESVVLSTGNMFAGLYYPVSVAAITFFIGAFLIKERKLGR
jgi:MFS family permease